MRALSWRGMGSRYLKPSFFIIGERKCGTSSLYRYLCEHPGILPCKVKEPQFFSQPVWQRVMDYHKYLSLFPLAEGDQPVRMEWIDLVPDSGYLKRELVYERQASVEYITGEASANTFAQVPPDRLYRYFPAARLIVLFRDPVARAYSHYRMLQRFADEGRRLPFRPTDFLTDTRNEIERIDRGERTYFVGQGMYATALSKWYDCFGREQVLVLFSENLKQATGAAQTMNQVCEFLGVPAYDFGNVLSEQFNVAPGQQIEQEARTLLEEFYSPHNKELAELTKKPIPWM